MWQPCLETGAGHILCFEVWFTTEKECEDYIRDMILPAAATMLPLLRGAHPDYREERKL